MVKNRPKPPGPALKAVKSRGEFRMFSRSKATRITRRPKTKDACERDLE
jgi:hypothetical protein